MRSRYPAPVSPELRAGIELHNKANKIANIESRKPMRVQREEARQVRRELMHDATMTKKRRSRTERIRQAALTAKRELIKQRERVGAILAGLPGEERKTELGIILPSGADLGKVLTRVRD